MELVDLYSEIEGAVSESRPSMRERNLEANIRTAICSRRAEYGLQDFGSCMRDLKKVIELDPQNREARALLKEANAGQKEDDKKSKGLFAKMCQGLGKGPIPEPKKDAAMDDFGDADDPEEPAEAAEAGEAAKAPEAAQP